MQRNTMHKGWKERVASGKGRPPPSNFLSPTGELRILRWQLDSPQTFCQINLIIIFIIIGRWSTNLELFPSNSPRSWLLDPFAMIFVSVQWMNIDCWVGLENEDEKCIKQLKFAFSYEYIVSPVGYLSTLTPRIHDSYCCSTSQRAQSHRLLVIHI